MVHGFNASTKEVEEERFFLNFFLVRGQPGAYIEFQTSQSK